MIPVDSFRAARWLRTINLALQAILFTTFFAGLNYVALHYHWRHDLTRYHRHSLSSETLSYLQNLKRPVRIIATFSENFPDPEAAEDIRGLLREYAIATATNGEQGRVTLEFLDIYQRPRDARDLGLEQSNAIFFLCGDSRRGVSPGELYRREEGDKKEFLGEQVFTAAILDVSSPEQKKIYFLAGHGEYRIDDVSPGRGLSGLRDELRLRNFAVEATDLSTARKVPKDASLIIIAAPQRIEPYVEEQLRQYLSNDAGRVILLLPTRVQHGLSNLLNEWGVWDHDVVIMEQNSENLTEENDLRIRAFDANHPITKSLIERGLTLRVGETRCVMPYPDRQRGSGLSLTTLAATSTTAWGERSYQLQRRHVYNPESDLRGNASMEPKGRLGVAVASEPVQARGNLPFSVRKGRLVVFGSADLVVNSRLSGSQGNQTLFLNAINWAVDRDTQLAIPPRPIEKFQLNLSQDDLLRLRYALLFGIPGLVALIGIAVTWTRRR